MSDFLPVDFTVDIADSGFQAEFAQYLFKRDIYLDMSATAEERIEEFQGYRTTIECGVIPSQIFVRSIAFTERAILRLAQRMSAVTEIPVAELIAEIRASNASIELAIQAEIQTLQYAAGLKYTSAFYAFDFESFTEVTRRQVNNDAEIARAFLAMLNAQAVLYAAISAAFGDSWVVFKKIADTRATRILSNANTLTLGLLPPVYETTGAVVFDDDSAGLHSSVNPRHINTSAYFEWGLTEAYGNFLPATPSPLGNGIVAIDFAQLLEGLEPETTYHFRVVAVSYWLGQFTGSDKTFTTPAAPPPSHTVTFDGNSADGGSMSPQVASAPTALNSNSFTLSDSTFSKWNTQADGEGEDYANGATYLFDGDITLYAQWTANHTVTFDGNESDGGLTAPQSSGVPTALTSNGFTLSGYSFTGWNTAADGGGTAYADGATYSFDSSITLYAQWITNTHTVTFDGNGNTSGSMSPQSADTATPLSVNLYEKADYIFVGWNTAADGSGTGYIDGEIYSFGIDITLYAQWNVI